jgi:hypothetical protein
MLSSVLWQWTMHLVHQFPAADHAQLVLGLAS